MEENKIYICLANGDVFEGKRFGANGEVTGELVFTTGMGGYIETLTLGKLLCKPFLLSATTALSTRTRKAKNPTFRLT